MKSNSAQTSDSKKDSTRLFFYAFLALLALGFVYMITLLFTI